MGSVAVVDGVASVEFTNEGGTVTVVYTGGGVTKMVLVVVGVELVEVVFGDVVVLGRVTSEAWSMPSGGDEVLGWRVVAGAWSMPSPTDGRGLSEENAVGEGVSMTSALLGSRLSCWEEEKSAESLVPACGAAVALSAPERTRRADMVIRMRNTMAEDDGCVVYAKYK